MVAPEREIPGIGVMACKNPTAIALILSLALILIFYFETMKLKINQYPL